MFQEAFDCPIVFTPDIFLLVPTMCSLLNHSEPKSCAVPKVCFMSCLTDQLSRCHRTDLS